MTHEVLSVKLCELDEKINTIHQHIYQSGFAKHSQIKEEIEALQKECEESDMILCDKLQFSKAESVASLYKVYEKVTQIIKDANIKQAVDENNGNAVEEKILLAEYSLDFAIQLVNHALLTSLEAIDVQMTQQEKEERS